MKRYFDIVLSMVAIVFLGPLLLIIMIMVKADSSGPVFFCQRRIGKDDKEFLMYKFRTMHIGTPEVATDKLTNPQQYITRVGYYLRKYSLDELPQLINILAGDMSIVGPRPALYNQYDLRDMRNRAGISQVRPGLTGWAQINGRDEIPLEQKVALDAYYVANRSLWLDCKIIFCTAFSVYTGTGVNKENSGSV